MPFNLPSRCRFESCCKRVPRIYIYIFFHNFIKKTISNYIIYISKLGGSDRRQW
jgi:hypothetical protein